METLIIICTNIREYRKIVTLIECIKVTMFCDITENNCNIVLENYIFNVNYISNEFNNNEVEELKEYLDNLGIQYK